MIEGYDIEKRNSQVAGNPAARAPMKVWLFAVLLRHLRSRAFAIEPPVVSDDKPALESERFSAPGERWEGHWRWWLWLPRWSGLQSSIDTC